MKTQKLMTILLTISMLVAAAPAENEPASELTNARYAEAMLRIRTDPQVLPMGDAEGNTTRLDNVFLLSPQVLDKSLMEVFGDHSDDLKACISLQSPEAPKLIGGLQTMRVKFSISLDASRQPLAREFFKTYIDHLNAELMGHFRYGREIFKDNLRQYFQLVDQAQSELINLQKHQNELSPDMPMDKEAVLQRRQEHERAARDIGLQQSILKLRAQEIPKRIKQTCMEIENKIQSDEILRQLHGLLDQQEAEMRRVEQAFQAGTISEGQAGQLREKLMRTQIELAQRKEQLQNEAGDQQLRQLNQQLHETTMQLEELERRQMVLSGTDPGLLSKSSEYEILQVRINAAKENLHNAIMEKNTYERRMNLIQPPIVRVDNIEFSAQAPDAD